MAELLLQKAPSEMFDRVLSKPLTMLVIKMILKCNAAVTLGNCNFGSCEC